MFYRGMKLNKLKMVLGKIGNDRVIDQYNDFIMYSGSNLSYIYFMLF